MWHLKRNRKIQPPNCRYRQAERRVCPTWSVVVDGGLRVVILPVEPIIFEKLNFVQAGAGCRSAGGAACEVPGVALGVDEFPVGGVFLASGVLVGRRRAVEVDIRSIQLRAEDADGLAVGSQDERHGNAGDFVCEGGLGADFGQGEGSGLAAEMDSQNYVAIFQTLSGKGQRDGIFCDLFLPLFVVVFVAVANDRGQDESMGGFRLPQGKGEFVIGHEFQGGAFHVAGDGTPRGLLPPRTCFTVAHQEILVVDARQVEMEFPSLRCSLPHQTGVTKCSISDDDGFTVHRVVENVVISHLEDGVGAGLRADPDCHDHFFVGEVSVGCGDKAGGSDGVEHPLKIVLSRHHGRGCGEQESEYEAGAQQF